MIVRHWPKIFVKLAKKLNPGQVPIITADQLVHARGKQVQSLYQHGFDNIIWMIGPPHIEMMFLNIIGTWVDGSAQPARNIPGTSPKGPNVWDLQGTFRGLLEDQ